jgi:hypothetical protein
VDGRDNVLVMLVKCDEMTILCIVKIFENLINFIIELKGGPLLVDGIQVGIASWSIKPCTLPPYPGVFTNVVFYIGLFLLLLKFDYKIFSKNFIKFLMVCIHHRLDRGENWIEIEVENISTSQGLSEV